MQENEATTTMYGFSDGVRALDMLRRNGDNWPVETYEDAVHVLNGSWPIPIVKPETGTEIYYGCNQIPGSDEAVRSMRRRIALGILATFEVLAATVALGSDDGENTSMTVGVPPLKFWGRSQLSGYRGSFVQVATLGTTRQTAVLTVAKECQQEMTSLWHILHAASDTLL